MGQSFPEPALRPFLPADASLLAAIFRASVEELTEEDYSEAQRAAWAAGADDLGEFTAKLSDELTLVATVAHTPVGFASLQGPDHLDMLYVHPNAAGQGIGTALCDALERLAASRGATKLTVDASDNARPFFEHRGFEAQHRNTVPMGGEWFGNTRMQKRLTKDETARTTQ